MDCKIGVMYPSLYYPFAFFGVLRTFFAKKVLSRRRQNRLRRRYALDQRYASLTRKSLPSVASNYQADFCSQGIKSRRTCRRLLMDYTF